MQAVMKSEKIMFTGKVVVITGAGRGLGKDFALFFASRGAKVVVNDIGLPKHEMSNVLNSQPAQEVVDLAKANGGIAVANYDNAVEGHKVIKSAIDNFGKIDILINNAGVVLMKSFTDLTIEDYQYQMRSNVETAFSCSQAAWPYFVKQKSGKIVNLTSPFGLYGSHHVIPYSMSKAAMIALTKSLAVEGRQSNIQVNGVAPMALSRMTEDHIHEDIKRQDYGPEKVTPILAYLCMDSCNESGAIFEASCGWISKVRVQRAKGTFFNKAFELEDVIEKVGEINNFEKSTSDEREHSLSVVINLLKSSGLH